MKARLVTLLLAVGSVTTLIAGCASDTQEETGTDEGEIRTFRPSRTNPDESLPASLYVNGYSFSGFEYWPYKHENPYPDHIQWGFSAGSDPARLCMAEATRSLAKILENPPRSLVQLKEKHGISSFFNWNNDYTDAPGDGIGYHRRLWLYNGRLIKWISETNGDGSCRIPSSRDLDRFAKATLEQLGTPAE